MKAKAPEKLYLHPTANDKVGASWVAFPLTNKDVEYTRTDAFIEKATLWLLTNASDYVILHNGYDTKKLVRNFVYAMKRE